MSNLLQVIRQRPQRAMQGKNMPMWMDMWVDSETSPYLVTSGRNGVLWAEEAVVEDDRAFARAGVQCIDAPGILFAQMLVAVIERGLRDQWGNIQPYTEAGLRAAIAHVEFYDLTDLEVLVSREPSGEARPDWIKTTLAELNVPGRTTSWLPDNSLVVLPRQRAYVGTLHHLDAKNVTAIVHNAARGIAVAITAGGGT